MHKDAPCKGCGRKYPACHDHCEDYKQWKKAYLEEQAARKEYKRQNREDFLRSEQCHGIRKNWRY